MRKGFTVIELIVSIGLVVLMATVLVVLVDAPEAKARARDEKTLSNISKFDSEVGIYKLENDIYPNLTPPSGVTYVHTNNSYELNVVLEYYLEKSQEDGGNDAAVYEIGNDLTLL